VSYDSGSRPGVGSIVGGLVIAGLTSAPVATGWAPGLKGLLFALGGCAIGAILCKVGWHHLQRTKAVRLDMTWWQFLGTDLIGLGIVAMLLAGLAAMPREQRDALLRTLREFSDALGIARGRP